jgi:hypothetical protein
MEILFMPSQSDPKPQISWRLESQPPKQSAKPYFVEYAGLLHSAEFLV